MPKDKIKLKNKKTINFKEIKLNSNNDILWETTKELAKQTHNDIMGILPEITNKDLIELNQIKWWMKGFRGNDNNEFDSRHICILDKMLDICDRLILKQNRKKEKENEKS